ncbi:hypothetical protein [Microbulbifer aggregans]|uniref:hypothetical protein n=1 Tax=Microbulbifer aggregans TaxID=1769779 RepID=UPI001CFD8B78|nr:hypothetical protein [Microbulbifer aggregans]
MPLLPACSLVRTPQQTLEGFPPETLQLVRHQSAELIRLQNQTAATPAQQQLVEQLQRSLRQFERDVISNANNLEQQGDWHGAEQILQGGTRVLPDSLILIGARQALAERRQLREERVRMELEIHRGEQLLKDVAAYQRLKQLQGPGLLNWLELKNFHRKRRASAQALQEHAQRALEREDYSLAHRALTVSQGLYGDDLEQDHNLRAALEQDLALANSHLRPVKRQPVKRRLKQDQPVPVDKLQQALDTGDLLGAQQHLDQLQRRFPQHPELIPLQTRYRTQVKARVLTAIKRGNDLYSRGYIERALAVWREAKALAPENVELLANIARAEKVLRNLRALSKPPGTQPGQ